MTLLPKSPLHRRLLFAVLAAGLIGRLAFCWLFPQWGPGGSIPNIGDYQTFAESLLREGSLLDTSGNPSAMREPAYSFLLAGVYTITGPSYRAAQALNCVLGTLTLLLIFSLGLSVFGPRVAWTSLIVATGHPQLVFYTTSLERECFQVLLVVLTVWLLIWAVRKPLARRFLLAGAVSSLIALTNSALLPMGMLLAAGIWPLSGWGRRQRINAALYLAAFLLVYSPWPIRNYLTFDRVIIGITLGGSHLYHGIIVPNDAAGTDKQVLYTQDDPVWQEGFRLPPAEQDKFFYKASLDWVMEHPMRFARVMTGSVIKLWRPHPYERAYAFNYQIVKWVALLSDGWIIPLGFLGIFLSRRRDYPGIDFFNLVLFGATAVYMVFWSIIRYRLPMMPFMIILSARTLEVLAEKWLPGGPRGSTRH